MPRDTIGLALYGIFLTAIGVAAAIVFQAGYWLGTWDAKTAGMLAAIVAILFFLSAVLALGSYLRHNRNLGEQQGGTQTMTSPMNIAIPPIPNNKVNIEVKITSVP